MKRSPIVAVGTVVGLASVLNFHSSPAKISLSAVTNVPTSAPVTTTTKKEGTNTTTSVAPTTTPPTTPPTTTSAPSSTPTAGAPTTTTPRAATTTAPTTTTAPPRTTTTAAPTTTTVAPTTTTAAATGVRTVTGPLVNYFYGVLSVKVTANGKKITTVTIGSINDGGNPRSQQIDQYAVPILAQEAMAAQSSSIQSISGASYTSAGFQMSLQYALKKLGI